jgi:UV DNA damage repair endonuclease
MIKHIGFCCKFVELKNNKIISIPELNTSSTTVAWMKRQATSVAEQKLWDLMVHNLKTTENIVDYVSKLEPNLRMLRLSSDILPLYTEPNFKYFWKRTDVISYLVKNFARVGEIARTHGVRLSFHPGQYCVLASASDDIIEKSIEEFEYHVDMARWMGYGHSWHDHGFKINVHVSGKRGIQGIINVLSRLSPEARNLITIENDEITYGLDSIIQLEKYVALVLDIHHHFIHTNEYIDVKDDRVQRVIYSWRGTRPVLHYSVSREDVLMAHDVNVLPNRNILNEQGINNSKLRAHSDFYWNNAANDWAHCFWNDFDICCESKAKNLASFKLLDYFKTKETLE